MLKQEKKPINIVDIDSSDDEDGVGGGKGKNTSSSLQGRPQVQSNLANPLLASRSFWKAGNYDVGPTKSVPAQGQLEHARVHPKFLHSNATSHKWAFGAIAELLDNAVDEEFLLKKQQKELSIACGALDHVEFVKGPNFK
ncbi:compromized recognition of TCV 1 [Actinidia rufa]|uniref:Compromized recognition of TCV 1 n=1 Tax=Actinidia rufa TaxID=165716 RepID=A0A7J0EQI9_9ERIC|nr:compromized recognition of TCV 1 [Actinidia rufa]